MADPFRPAGRKSMVLATLADLWDKAKRRQQISQKLLAQCSGVPLQTINSWSTGKSAPRNQDQVAAVGRVLAEWARERPRIESDWSNLMRIDRDIADTLALAEPVRVPIPVQLPLDVANFVGRHRELARLAELPRNVVAAIDGTAGVGKTALAVHAAHQWRDRFPDGQLYVELGDNDPAVVLAGFLRDLGHPPDGIPPETPDRAKLYRSMLADRRILVVLDNATSEAQVRPLLPGAGLSRAIITSRHSLAGLEIASNARITLDTLSENESVNVLVSIAGHERVQAERDAVVRVAELCDRLPLALSIAGHVLTVRSTWTFARLADRLGDERHRLDELESGDRGVRAAFTVSYAQLKPILARMFRLLGLHPGRDITAPTAGALASVDKRAAARRLDALAQAHLIREHVPERFAMHDLLHLFAHERSHHDEDASAREAALRRMFVHYWDLTDDVGQRWLAAWEGATPRDALQIIAILDEERANITAVALLAATKDKETLWHIATNLAVPLSSGRFFTELLAIFHAVRDTAHEAGARPLEFKALIRLGNAYRATWRSSLAVTHLEQALTIAREDKVVDAECAARNDLGLAYRSHGDFDAAIDCLQIAARLSAETGDRAAEAGALDNLAATYTTIGRPDLAVAPQQQASRIFESLDQQPDSRVITLLNQARMQLSQQAFDDAMTSCQESLAIARELGDRELEGQALNIISNIHLLQDRDDDCYACRRQAVELLQDTNPIFAEMIKASIPSDRRS